MIISFRNIDTVLGRKEILKGVSLSAGEGKLTGIIGPNGSGKSTLIKTVFGICPRNQGEILVGGRPVETFSQKELASVVGYVGQEANCAFDFTVSEIAAMGMYARADRSRPADVIVTEALEALHISHLRDRNLMSLSGGERKMVFIARAIVQGTDLLILDEPTNHLDLKHQLFLLDFLKKSGKTVLIVLHDLRLAAHYCDRLYLLADGQTLCSGPPQAVLTREIVRRIFGVPGNVCELPDGTFDFSLF